MFYIHEAMTPVEIKAAHRMGAALLRQSKEQQRDAKQHAATKEDWPPLSTKSLLKDIMFVPSTQTIILAIIGMLGLFSTGIILSYSFRRNRTGSGKYQWSWLVNNWWNSERSTLEML